MLCKQTAQNIKKVQNICIDNKILKSYNIKRVFI